MDESDRLSRTRMLYGTSAVERFLKSKVLVVGVGGVGGWCVESLVRTGVGHVTIVDDDLVRPSNMNRQCVATMVTVGMRKVDAMTERMALLNLESDIFPLPVRYPNPAIDVGAFDLVVDAIDSVSDKAELIRSSVSAGVPVVSSMGAALRRDPTKVVATEFSKVCGDGLARALRNRFRKNGGVPGEFTAVWSTEPPADLPERGSAMPVVGAFGMVLAAEALRILSADPLQQPVENAVENAAAKIFENTPLRDGGEI